MTADAVRQSAAPAAAPEAAPQGAGAPAQAKLSSQARAALADWLQERGLGGVSLRALGCEAVHRPRLGGWCVSWPYRFADGSAAPERLLLLEGANAGEWRWGGSGAKGAVWPLGDANAGELVFIVEGESDGLAAWRLLEPPCSGTAVLVVPGSNMVGDDLGNWVGHGATVVLATDADPAGDKCAETCVRVLLAAGIHSSSVRRLRPEVPGKELPDLRDLVEHLREQAGEGNEREAAERLRALGAAAPAAEDTVAEDTVADPPLPIVVFVPLGDYVAHPKGSPDALLGAGDDVLLPVGGLLMAYGDAGAGKTTFDLDAVAHLASGSDWVGITVTRPVKVALIQNEGPAEPWRRKLESKLGAWTGEPWRDNVLVLDEPHGGFDFRIPEHQGAIRELRRQGVELVVADPTKWLGVEGGGTPSEVREFVELLKECGLHSGDPETALAFWLAHHENVRGEISGAWRADPDTVVHVEGDGNSRTKATWAKCRWSSGRHGQRMILAWAAGEGFELIDIPDRPTLGDEDVDTQVLAFVTTEADEGRRPGMVKVREAVSVRSERVDAALERLKERGEILDLDRKGCPHPGTAGTPRYWIPVNHAGSEAVRGGGTASDSFDFGPQDGERAAGEAVPLSRHKEGQPPPGQPRWGGHGEDDKPRCSICEKPRERSGPGEPYCRCEGPAEDWRALVPDDAEAAS